MSGTASPSEESASRDSRLYLFAQELSRQPIDEMQPGAGQAGNGLILVMWPFEFRRGVIQRVLDIRAGIRASEQDMSHDTLYIIQARRQKTMIQLKPPSLAAIEGHDGTIVLRSISQKVAASPWGRAGRARSGLGRGGVGM